MKPSSLFAFAAIVSISSPAIGQIQWTQRFPAVGPSARAYHAMAYDSARGVTVLFGGYNGPGMPNGETWEWNGTVWTQRAIGGPGPSPRNDHAMAYDVDRHVIVLFGGQPSSGFSGETWEWNGTVWSLIDAGGVGRPVPRIDHCMAYDRIRHVTVLFGGYDITIAPYGDTWTWNGANWTLVDAGGAGRPSPRAQHAMDYDAARGVTVLFGGGTAQGSTAVNGETWEWNGSTWTQQAVSGPSSRKIHAMAYDAFRGATVLFGGHTAPGVNPSHNGETWEWNGSTWVQQAISGPAPRYNHAMAYDEARRVTVLFGGDISGSPFNAETWELGPSTDCNTNGTPDTSELAGHDCNSNGTPDECDVRGYRVVDLGTPGNSPHSVPLDINEQGHVVGLGTTDPLQWTDAVPFYYSLSDGGMTILPVPPGGTVARADGVNASDTVVGGATINGIGQAFVWRRNASGAWTGSPLFQPGETLGFSLAYSVNDLEQVTGMATSNDGSPLRAFLSRMDLNTNTTTYLPAGIAVRGLGVNNYGQVSGDAFGGVGFIWTPNQPNGTTGIVTPIPTFGGSYSAGFSISSEGLVTGTASVTGNHDRAFLWTPAVANGATGSMLNLGTLGGTESFGYDVLDDGALSSAIVVGHASTQAGDQHAAMWHVNGSAVDVEDLNQRIPAGGNWELLVAQAINGSGWIAAQGRRNGHVHAVLLIPVVDCNTNEIPDECEDCDTNGTADACESLGGDCNTNGIPDLCELAGHDCNTNGTPDVCELAGNDCNANGELDACEPFALQRLSPPQIQAGDNFGADTAISADVAMVGSTLDDNSNGIDAGAVYVYRKIGAQWIQGSKLIAPDGAADDRFGRVAVDGDWAVIGAGLDDDGALDAGSAYIYHRTAPDTWAYQTKLHAGDPAVGDGLGEAVAISGDTVVIGARMSWAAGASGFGKAYVFSRNQGGADHWGQVRKLTASDAQAGDEFGHSVGIDGDVIAVGAVNATRNGVAAAGRAYVFERNRGGASSWGQASEVAAMDGTAGDQFGFDVDLNGDTVVVSAANDDDLAMSAGSAYVYQKPATGWVDTTTHAQKIAPTSLHSGDYFGQRVVVSVDRLVVSAGGDDDAGQESGAVYVFQRPSGGSTSFSLRQKIINPDARAFQRFGIIGGLWQDLLIVGNNGSGSDSAPAYVFDLRSHPFVDCNTNATADACEGDLRPCILTQPQDVIICTGNEGPIWVVAGCVGPFRYEWHRVDATGDHLLPNWTGPLIRVGTPGEYYVRACNDDCGCVESDHVELITMPRGTGDGNSDGVVDGADVQGMVDALLRAGPTTLADHVYDVDCDNFIDGEDIQPFVALLLP